MLSALTLKLSNWVPTGDSKAESSIRSALKQVNEKMAAQARERQTASKTEGGYVMGEIRVLVGHRRHCFLSRRGEIDIQRGDGQARMLALEHTYIHTQTHREIHEYTHRHAGRRGTHANTPYTQHTHARTKRMHTHTHTDTHTHARSHAHT